MAQFNYPSSGIGKKERKKYTFSNFRGVDTSVAPINVDPVRAVESINFVDRDGVLHKRYGWEQVYKFDGEINGFWKIVLGGDTHTICYANKTFYLLSKYDGWVHIYTSDKLVSRRAACYVNNDKAYFIGCGDLLVYRLDIESGEYKMFRVVDDADTYIPTTTASILSQRTIETGRNAQYVRDSVNILTGWRKNTLVGEAVPDGETLQYQLDAPPNINESIKISCSGEIYEPTNTLEGASIDLAPDTTILNDRTIKFTPLALSVENEEGLPDIEYDAIPEVGEFASQYADGWVLKLADENGSVCGLKWLRLYSRFMGPQNDVDLSKYRVYELCFVGGNPIRVKKSLLRRIYFEKEGTEFPADVVRDHMRISTEWLYDIETDTYGKKIAVSSVPVSGDERVITLEIDLFNDDQYLNTVEKTITMKSSYASFELWFGKRNEAIVKEIECRIASAWYYDTTTHRAITEEEALKKGATMLYKLPMEESYGNTSEYLKDNKINVVSVPKNYNKVINFLSPAASFDYPNFSCTINNEGIIDISKWEIEGDTSHPNVTVQFYTNTDKSDLITKSKYSTLYGVDGEVDRLFVVNGDDPSKNNIIFFSEMDNFSYFPDNFTKTVGGTTNEVQGFIRLANGSMAALKTLKSNEPTVYVFSGEYMTGHYDAEGLEEYTLPRFSTSGVSTTQGIVAPYACDNLADDSMFISQNGVYALELSQGTDSQRFAKERSLPINNLLKECNIEELQDACAITYQNKYYLAVKHYKKTTDKTIDFKKKYYEKTKNGYAEVTSIALEKGMSQYYEQENCVYVADAHYFYTPLGAMADAPSYEWYPLSNIPVRAWFLIDEELYFGTTDGRVCRFMSKGYYDIEKRYFANAPESSEAKAVSQSTVSALTSSMTSGIYDADLDNDGALDTFAIDKNMEIYEVSNGEYDRDTIIFVSGELYGNVYGEAKDLIGEELYIKKLYDESGNFTGNIQLLYDEDGEPIQFSSAVRLVAEIRRRRIVKANRSLPTFDFGMPDYLKSLESFTVEMNGTQGGPLVVDILTRNNIAKKNTAHMSEGTSKYSSLQGLGEASFNVPFQNSYTKKIAIRNFNYVIIKVNNDQPEDCSLASLSLIYKYNRASGGIK